MNEELEKEFIKAFMDEYYYPNKKAATKLFDLFDKDYDSIWNYIQVGRQFWLLNFSTMKYELLTVTYKRSNVVFYTIEGSDKEESFQNGSYNCISLYPRVLYIQDVYEHVKKNHPDKEYDDVAEMYRKMELDIPQGTEIDVVF